MAKNKASKKDNVQFQELSITSWKDQKGVDISNGLIQLKYHESILSNHITASMVIGETGNTVDKGKYQTNLVDGLPVRGGEPVRIKCKDPKGNTLKFVDDTALYVNTVRDAINETQRAITSFDLCTKEFLANEQSRVVKRYSGKISESVKKILKDVLKTKNYKPRDIEETANSYNFIGNIKKPFYSLTWLAAKGIPSDGAYGATAGFLFFQTQDGFQFKSLETLVGPTQGGGSADKKSAKAYEYTNTDKKTPGMEKIVQYNVNQNINVQEKLTVGAYNTRFLFFNPFTFEVGHSDFDVSKDQDGKVKPAGKGALSYVAEEFRTGTTRGISTVLDVGTLPPGKDAKEQLKRWKDKKEETNDKVQDRMVQSITRYNQVFSVSVDIMIEADFSLRAGDTIYCEFPDVASKTKALDKETSGNYLIASLCHQINAEKSFTVLNLIRDSFGTRGRPEGIMRVLTGIADHMTGNFFDFDKRGGWLGPNSRI